MPKVPVTSFAANAEVPEGSPVRRHRRGLARRLLSGAAWAFVAKLVGMASALAVNAILARMLTPEEMGAYFLLVSIVMFAAVLARLGLKQTVVRLVAESMALGQPGRARAALRIVYVITAIGTMLVSGAYFLGLGAWLAESVFNIPLLVSVAGASALWIAVIAFQTPVAETFRGLHDIRTAMFLDGILASAFLAIALALLWFAGVRLEYGEAVLLSLAAAGCSLALGTVYFLSRRRLPSGPGSVTTGEVLHISGPLFVTNVADLAMTNLSLWVVAAYLAAEQVALYGAAWRLVALVALPILLINLSVQPSVAELYALGDKTRLQKALRGTATLAGLPALLVIALFFLEGAPILELVFGPHYREAAEVLVILSIGQLVNAWTGSCRIVLALTGHQRQLMWATLVTGAISAGLVLLGVPLFGLLGAAVAVTAGRILQNTVLWLLVWRLTGLWTHLTVRPSFLREAVRRTLRPV